MTVEFEECIKDSPRFRATIDEVETDVVEIEAKLDKLVKLCSGVIEAGKAYVTTNRLFVSGVRDLSQQCQGDTVISECLQRFGDSLQEMVTYHMILFDQAQRSVRQQLHNFVKEDVRKFKETKKQFDRVREDMELSLARNAQAPRHRPHEAEEAAGALVLARKCFRHLALDYVLQINVLQAKKKFEILDSMLSFMHAQYSFFQQGYSLLHQLDPYMKKLAAELDQLVIDSAVEKREMERKHAAIQQRTLLQVSGRPPRGEGAPGGQGLCPSRPAAFQHQGHLHGPGAAPDARPAPAEVAELGPRPLRPLREQLQLSPPAPTQPGEQVAGPPLPLPDAQDNAQCLPSPREWSSVRLVGEPSWRHEWGTASFLIPEAAALPGWGVGAGALRAPSCDGRHLPPRGFGSGSGCEDAPPTSPLGQPERAAVSPQPRVGAHWGLGSDHPQDFSYDEPKVEFDVDAPSGVVMEGYLFKRASNAFKTWNRRWFSIQNSQLVYQKKLKDVLTVVVDDLRLCSVKPCEDVERRFCFEVVSPTKSCMLQADSEKLRQAWVQAVQASIASAYRESPDSCYRERLDRTASPSTSSIDSATDSRERSVKGESVLQRMQHVAGNSQCGDCGRPDPRWASINLGVLLCIECSGIHRSLGVHCSKVRSLTLDSWEPELLKLMCELGNSTVNQIYEAQCAGPGSRKPTASSPRTRRLGSRTNTWKRSSCGSRPRHRPGRPHGAGGRRSAHATTAPPVPAPPAAARSGWSPSRPLWLLCAQPGSRPAGSTEPRFRRDSLFCPDELDSLFSYFDAGAAAAGPRSLSSDSGLGGSSDGSSDVLAFGVGSVVDRVTEEEGAESEESSGEADGEAEAWGLADVRELHPGLLAHRAARTRDLPALAAALAQGAEVNWADAEDEGKTPLVQAVLGGSLIICEFLLQNGADVNQRDSRGRAPLHHATLLGRTGQVCLFLKRGADQHALDHTQQDPLSIAVQEANADIVTLLRLARMAEEMREAEAPAGQPGPLAGSSPTELQYRRCIQEFISLHLDES
ncbi:arf-GAP with coiled-coil, ANK repeat and PH domain-containing protein 3 isoform X3 [Lagenorhynchus albirostris]|uniref:arf-GAP with coiled-coil, ANK repeat and PH domain-containing protein 3 isoform X3 n=1 Tax=Lagenorhynchus albirostris TaxID=27610 RepID=UPI0028EF4AE8|nr:arf-GAP with coiled-coil, ANK repeat and PH domain-containing protein 3 isoform X3 [Lagenorhynchus albirostris]